jgi:hypothetical protein
MTKPDTPCAECGKLLWGGQTSLPAGQRTCLDCRRARTAAKVAARPPRRPKRRSACARCGNTFVPVKAKQTYCSKSCAARSRPPRLKRAKATPEVTLCKVHFITCVHCGKLFTTRRRRRICSTACRKARQAQRYYTNPKYRDGILHSGHARRAHKLGLDADHTINLSYIIKRDRGRCGICHKPVRAKRGRRGPSIDHIIPLSIGGTHTLDNVQLAHLACNWSKNNRGGDEQMLLFG